MSSKGFAKHLQSINLNFVFVYCNNLIRKIIFRKIIEGFSPVYELLQAYYFMSIIHRRKVARIKHKPIDLNAYI